ncbi:MAG: ribonuclease Z [Psychroflexus sp.]|nr:ribonuclease Z [Psychroflexus sp.]MDR9448786.1 ribonuclease Z [Psychroflexus sp.]
MQLHILGCHSASPLPTAHPTSQVLTIRNHQFLIDCGEGTQVRMRLNKIKFTRVKHIFISHLHGDHFYGLIGFISTQCLLQRETEIHIYGPKGIKQIILLQLKLANTYTSYSLYFHELSSDEPEIIFEDEQVTVSTIPLVHRVYTNGFLFQEKLGERKLNIDAAQRYPIDPVYYNSIKQGKDIKLDDGRVIDNEKLTFPPDKPLAYAFCSDTQFQPRIAEQIADVDLLYHESTFLEEHEDLCEVTKHSTAKQAGIIAQKANAGRLILGHYSSRYKKLERFQQEAQEVFENVELAQSGKVFEVE